MNTNALIVTRHAGLVEHLRNLGYTGEVIAHATPEQVRDKAVIGVLPIGLASLAVQVGVIDLNLPPELRGVELSLEQVQAHASTLKWYIVRECL